MILHAIRDWDGAYANGANIAGSERWPEAWNAPASAFRERLGREGRAELDIAYAQGRRNRLDLFLPEGSPRGLVVFIHGGYWKAFDKSVWSHLAEGPVARGFAVAMPSYTLCPENTVSGITAEIGQAVEKAASRVAGEIRLTGHSAGGHLATRMISATSPLSEPVRARIVNTVSLAGLHDLRPLMRTEMNAVLGLDEQQAAAESPALLEPMPGARVTCWVGAAERSEFIRQSGLLANIWTGLGAETAFVAEPDRHHFNVIDGLANPDHALTRTLLEV